jgi:hypothetical protein
MKATINMIEITNPPTHPKISRPEEERKVEFPS